MSRSRSKGNGKGGMTVFWGNICYICSSYVYNIAYILEWVLGGVARGGFVEYGTCCQYQLEQPWSWGVIIPSHGWTPFPIIFTWGPSSMASMGGICEEASGKCQNERETQISKGCVSSPPTPCN